MQIRPRDERRLRKILNPFSKEATRPASRGRAGCEEVFVKRLILVKHAMPDVIPGVPAREWHLSEAGRARCGALAQRLEAYHPDLVVTSDEPKAVETGALLAKSLGLPLETAPGLHEHERRHVPYMDRGRFEACVADFFDRSDVLVFGEETAAQARERFTSALLPYLEAMSFRAPVVVTHGTVMTLFVRALVPVDAFAFWKRLGLPSFCVLTYPDFRLEALVEEI